MIENEWMGGFFFHLLNYRIIWDSVYVLAGKVSWVLFDAGHQVLSAASLGLLVLAVG